MISRKDCLNLLDKHGIQGKVFNHILKVEQIAVFLGEKLKEKGIDINIDLLRASALLHDIGRNLADHTKMDHVEAGVIILRGEGLSEIADIIRKHSINAIVEEDKIPVTWEEKLVYYADKRACEDQLISIDERISDLKKRYRLVTKEESLDAIDSILSKGVLFRNRLIRTAYTENYSDLMCETVRRHYLVCPICEKKVTKVYISQDQRRVGCRKCLKIKSVVAANTSYGHALKIQSLIFELVNNPDIRRKNRNKVIKSIVTHYKNLDDFYKISYNFFVFKELQKWCLRMSSSSADKSEDYKKAMYDVLSVLKSIKPLVVSKYRKK